jgi:hypothetical protein
VVGAIIAMRCLRVERRPHVEHALRTCAPAAKEKRGCLELPNLTKKVSQNVHAKHASRCLQSIEANVTKNTLQCRHLGGRLCSLNTNIRAAAPGDVCAVCECAFAVVGGGVGGGGEGCGEGDRGNASSLLFVEKISRRASLTASRSSWFGGGRRMMKTSDRDIESAGIRSVLGSGATSPFTARVTPPELRIRTSFLDRRIDAIVAREVERL